MMRTGCCIHCIHARCLWCAQVSCFGQRGEGDEGDDFMLKVRRGPSTRPTALDHVVLCCSLSALLPLWVTAVAASDRARASESAWGCARGDRQSAAPSRVWLNRPTGTGSTWRWTCCNMLQRIATHVAT